MHLDESFWLAVSFILFIYFSYRPIKKAVLNSLDIRINDIKRELKEAEKLKKEAKDLLLEAESKISKIAKFKEEMLNEAEIDAEKLLKKKTQELEQFLKHKKTDAIQAIDNQKTQAFLQAKSEFTELVTKLVAQYCKESNNDSLPDSKIAQYIKGEK